MKSFTVLYEEIKNKDEASTYFYVIFFVRRILLAVVMVLFYTNSWVQITICIITSLTVLIYLVWVMPYKESIINKFSIFNEIWVFACCWTLLSYDIIYDDQSIVQGTTTFQLNISWVIIASSILCLSVNWIYLLPLKFYETFILIKNTTKKIANYIFKRKESKISKYLYPQSLNFLEPKELHLNSKDTKILNDTGKLNFKPNSFIEEHKRFDNTHDGTANISTNTVNIISNETLYPKENKFELDQRNQIKVLDNYQDGNILQFTFN